MSVLLRYILAAIAFGIAALGFLLLPAGTAHGAEAGAPAPAEPGGFLPDARPAMRA
ncbi:MAG: hypothetical protein BroJett013_13870 [Alphaproteobacteria bacterium]|nr:MAG: hypothetical protein BroJett013_13870 [Alphaproteobacteria bacterium]